MKTKFKATAGNRLVINNWLAVKDNSPALDLVYRTTPAGNQLLIVSGRFKMQGDKSITLEEIELVN